jgi:hypothetical protein
MGYMRSDAQVKRDELTHLFKEKYSAVASTIAPYFVWPDARLRAYIRENHILSSLSSPFSSSASSSQQTFSLPKSRSELLQETRIKWIQTTAAAEGIINKIRKILDDNVVGPVWEMLVGTGKGKEYAKDKYEDGREYADKKGKDASGVYEEKKSQAYAKVKGEM